MTSSADLAILMGVVELARRFGMRASDADASISQRDVGYGRLEFCLHFCDPPPEAVDKFDRMCSALGCGSDMMLTTNNLSQLEDAVERALSLAPRSRLR